MTRNSIGQTSFKEKNIKSARRGPKNKLENRPENKQKSINQEINKELNQRIGKNK